MKGGGHVRRDLDVHRERLWQLIENTPHLDWQLLTKRPELIMQLTRWGKRWPRNVWIGTTVEDQKSAAIRLPFLAAVPAAVRFISAEPLFGPLDLSPWIGRLDWVIAGGESGVHARPSSPADFRALRDQCTTARVPFFFKQWGEHAPVPVAPAPGRVVPAADGTLMQRLGKKAAGGMLDGRRWDQLPRPRQR